MRDRAQDRRIVVTGLGVVASNAVGMDAFREALKAGRSGIRRLADLEQLGFACTLGGVPPLEEQDVRRKIPFSEFESCNEAMVYAALAAIECAESSGVPVDLSRSLDDGHVEWNTGAVVGTSVGCGFDTLFEDEFPILEAAGGAEAGRGTLPMGQGVVIKAMGGSVSAVVSRFLGLGGQCTSNYASELTGLDAIFQGCKMISIGFADAMYVGGVDGSHPALWAPFDASGTLCSGYEGPAEKASRPMSASARGTVPSSGGAVLRLEALDAALERGAPILAEIVSARCGSGGRPGNIRRLHEALADAEVAPSELSLINGHLASTSSDYVEIQDWSEALKVGISQLPAIQATKSIVGNCFGAAGAIEAAAVVDQLARGYVHPSINCEDMHPELESVGARIARRSESRTLDFVLKTGSAAGGLGGCVLFKRWESE